MSCSPVSSRKDVELGQGPLCELSSVASFKALPPNVVLFRGTEVGALPCGYWGPGEPEKLWSLRGDEAASVGGKG